MNPGIGLENIFARTDSSLGSRTHRPPKLLLELEPWGRSFLHNLGDILLRRRPPAVTTTSAPAPFWHDVFVPRRMPWGAFAESILYHSVVLAVAWGWSAMLPNHPQVAQPRRFDPADVIYYSPSEYLPPLDTGASHPTKPRKGEPEYAKQAILSVPPEADNRHQTIVTPPHIKLNQDVQTPNIVAWGDRTVPVPIAATERRPTPLPALPNQIVAPAPDVNQASRRTAASLSQSIVAPPPDLHAGPVRAVASLAIDVVEPVPDATAAGTRRTLNAPQSPVVEPPPVVNAASVRKLGDLNLGRSDVIAPAPQLAVPAQRTLGALGGAGKAVVPPPPSLDGSSNGSAGVVGARGGQHAAALSQGGAQVVPPPPSIQGTHSSAGSGRLIALGIHPSVAPPPDPPKGNRRGTFAASPEGKPGAAGTPDIRGDSSGTDGHGLSGNRNSAGAGSGGASDAPAGLHVGAPPRPATSTTAGDPTGKTGGGSGSPNGTLMAAAVPPKSGAPVPAASHAAHGPKAELIDNPTPLDMQVFGGRLAYSMTLNMPNLNSAGGSWVIRFAELEGSGAEKGDLIAPVAEHKVDPAYPMELMRDNVSGTVTLRAIIRTDGSVADIKVVNGADKRLDHYAAQALSRWHFFPAEKNGAPVDVEAIVMIPFKPILRRPF
jgi:TonB family protein